MRPLISFATNYKSSSEKKVASYPKTAVQVACENHRAAGSMSLGKGYVGVSIVDVATCTLISNCKSKAITKIHSIVVNSSVEGFAKLRHPVLTIEDAYPLASDMEATIASAKIDKTTVGLYHLR
ncbi:unnamed protein product [Fraxinus pennsylvanica]|uniref:Uncharacterized protein n=1 Tax=Fraxinus pennsylvanica TaxID=56036 RepID=A0AAD1Z4M0_9LAMI|nr:unnamed protein product [Fraxinus pennsylvanica]